MTADTSVDEWQGPSAKERLALLRRAQTLLAQVEPAVGLYGAARELLGPGDRTRGAEAGQQRREVGGVGQPGVRVGDRRAAHRGRLVVLAHQGTLR